MKKAAAAAGAVLIASVMARVLVGHLSLYLEPYQVVRTGHVWQLVTWIPAGASLTFLAHAALVGVALARGGDLKQAVAVTFVAGALTTLLGFAVPAVFSCTFTGAGVEACAAVLSWGNALQGRRRLAVTALASTPALLDAAVDGLYVLVPFGFAFIASAVWVRWRRRAHQR